MSGSNPLNDKKYLDKVIERSKRVLRQDKLPIPAPMKEKMTRAKVRVVERDARQIAEWIGDCACANLANDVLRIVHNIDSLWMEIFPVFEDVQKKAVLDHCQIVFQDGVWRMIAPSGDIISEGESFRDFMVNHAVHHCEIATD